MHDISVVQAVLGSLAIFSGCMIAAMGGIGGGGLNVPLLVAIFGFDFKEAAILSLCVVLGSVSVQQYLNRNSSHPAQAERPLQYWDFIIVYIPGQLMGATAGIFVRDMIPQTVLECVSATMLVVIATKTMLKGRMAYMTETMVESENLKTPLLELDESQVGSVNTYEATVSSSPHVTEHDGSQIIQPWTSIGALIAAGITYTTIFASMTFVDKCSGAYVALLFSVFIPMAALETWSARRVVRKQEEDPSSVLKGDIDWKKEWHLGIVTAPAVGFIATQLGIGGGEITGPLMLHFEVLSQVTAGTTPVISSVSSFSSVVQYLILGEVPLGLGSWMLSLGILGGLTGRSLAMTISKKRPSVSIIALAVALYVGATLLIYNMSQDETDMEVEPYCNLW